MNHLMPGALLEFCFRSDSWNQNHNNNSYFTLPGIFVRFNRKRSESGSVRSPGSPLDFRIFSSFVNPLRHPGSEIEGYPKRWDCSKVGLSIIDSLNDGDDDNDKQSGNVVRSADSKRIIFEQEIIIRSPNFRSRASLIETPKPLPNDIAVTPNTLAKRVGVQQSSSKVLFEIGEASVELDSCDTFRACSLDSGWCRSHLNNFGNSKSRLGSSNFGFENTIKPLPSETKFLEGSLKLGSSSAEELSSIPPSNYSGTDFILDSEIELSEDYTCVRTHGPNPKVTHIFGDRILKRPNDEVTIFSEKSVDEIGTPESASPVNALNSYPSNDFLKFCYSCQRKLEGEDIYMYRGEKAFCSYSCRSQEIESDEENGESQQ